MKEVVEVKVNKSLGTIDSNLDAVKASIEAYIKDYENYVVSEDTVKDSKQLVTDLRKQKNALDDERKQIKKDWNVPFTEWEKKAKDVIALYDKPILLINDQLKEIKRQNIVASPDDIVELQMRIAFADIGNYAKFMNDGMGNVVQVSNSALVDTQIIQEVKEGKAGVSIKLADRQKAIDWLTAHFMMNPMDEHKAEFDKKRLELEYLKLDAQIKADEVADEDPEDNFLEALNAAATEVWGDEDGLE